MGPDDTELSIKDPAYSWHETLLRFPSLIRLYPLADSSEFEGGLDGEEGLNGIPPERREEAEEAEDPAESLIAQANAGAAAAAAALAEPEDHGRPEEVASPSWRS